MEKPEVGGLISGGRGQRSPVKVASLHIFTIFNGAGKGRDGGQRPEVGCQMSEDREQGDDPHLGPDAHATFNDLSDSR